jgi:hypothetical protein
VPDGNGPPDSICWRRCLGAAGGPDDSPASARALPEPFGSRGERRRGDARRFTASSSDRRGPGADRARICPRTVGTHIRLRARAGWRFYWVAIDGGELLRGDARDMAEELQQTFVDAMAKAGGSLE